MYIPTSRVNWLLKPKEMQPLVMIYSYEIQPLIMRRNFYSDLKSFLVIVKVHFPQVALSCRLHLGTRLVFFAMASQPTEQRCEGGSGPCVRTMYTLKIHFKSMTGAFLLGIEIQLLSSSEIPVFLCKRYGLENRKRAQLQTRCRTFMASVKACA